MLVFVRQDYPNKGYDWYIGDEKPADMLSFQDIIRVEASGLELEYVRERFRNLPDAPENSNMVWRGELAQFIYDNLK